MAKTIKELLDTRYELRRQTLQAVVTSLPLDADGKSKGHVVATVAGYANERVLIGPNDTYYVGDAIIVEQVGPPGMAYYRALGVTTPTRRAATGFHNFTGATTLSGTTYQAGDIVLGDPALTHGVFTSASIGFKYGGSMLTLWNSGGMNFPNSIKVDVISEYTTATGVTIDSVVLKDGTVDLNGVADALIIDADGDTSISAPTDDQIDIEIGGADDFRLTANTFTALVGSAIATDTINETTGAAGVTIDGVLLKDSIVTASGGLIAPTLKPAADSTTAVQIQTSGGAAIITVDTTNSRVKFADQISIGNTALDANVYLKLAKTYTPTANVYGLDIRLLPDTAGAYQSVGAYLDAGPIHATGTLSSAYGIAGGVTANHAAGAVITITSAINATLSNQAGNIGTAYGCLAQILQQGAGTITTAEGVRGYVVTSDGGTTTTARGVVGRIRSGTSATTTMALATGLLGIIEIANAAATITEARGLDLSGWVKTAGTVTTSYGIYIDTSIDVGATKWALYSLSTSKSLLSGILDAAAGLNTKQSVANMSNPPTDAELDAAFGTPATLGRGFIGLVDDNDDDTLGWLAWTSDASWYYVAGTKAV